MSFEFFLSQIFQAGLVRTSEERTMANKIMSEWSLCLAYNSPAAQEEARACVPLDSLRQRVDLDLLSPTEAQKSDPDWTDKAREHLLVVELLDWFKNDFFQWLDDVKCPGAPACGAGSLTGQGQSPPTPQEMADGARNVEM